MIPFFDRKNSGLYLLICCYEKIKAQNPLIISNKNYIKEVSIDGKATNNFNFKMGYFDLYVAQIMRAGN